MAKPIQARGPKGSGASATAHSNGKGKAATGKHGASEFSTEAMLRDIKKVVKTLGSGIMKKSTGSTKTKQILDMGTSTNEGKGNKKSASSLTEKVSKTAVTSKGASAESDTKAARKKVVKENTKQTSRSASKKVEQPSTAKPLNKGKTRSNKVSAVKDASHKTVTPPENKVASANGTVVTKGKPSTSEAISASTKQKRAAAAPTVKLIFTNVGNSEETFKRLIQQQVSSCGPYVKCLLGPDGKGVLIIENEAVAKEYMSHFNGYQLGDEQISVALASKDTTRGAKRQAVQSKEQYKSLILAGIPKKYEHDDIAKALSAISGANYKSLEKTDDGKWKLTFESVPASVKFSSLVNGCTINITQKGKSTKVKFKCEAPSFGKKAAHAGRVFVQNLPFNFDVAKLQSLVLPFDKKAKVNVPTAGKKGFAFVQFSSLQLAEKAISKLNGSSFGGRKIRLALSLPTEIYSDKSKTLQLITDSHLETKKENGEDSDFEPTESIDGDCLAVVDDGRPSPNGSHMPSSGVPSKKITEGDRTIFVRNLSFEATSDALKEYFSSYGTVESCNICKDAKGKSKGTAFVLFSNTEDVKKILSMEALALERDADFGVGASKSDKAKVKHSAVAGIGFSLNGRRLRLSMAVSREQANVISKANLDMKESLSKDKKTRDLLMEGVIDEKSPEFQKLTAKEKKLQIESLKEKYEKMKNPNMFINPKRLCVRNLPPTADVNELRRAIANHFRSDAKLSKICGFNKVTASRAIGKVTFLSDEKRKVKVGESTMRRRMPFAFIDFESHELALHALRFLSNNVDIYGAKNRLFAEFAIEDSRAIYIQNKRKEQYMAKVKEQSQTESGVKRKKQKTYSRGKQQRMKRRRLLEENNTSTTS